MQHEEIGNMETGRSADRRASSSTGVGARLAVQGLSRRAALTGAMGAVGLGALAACASPAWPPPPPRRPYHRRSRCRCRGFGEADRDS